jgi:hypothetical protein
MLKLSRNLFFHDPDPRYMHYYEQGLYNQIVASRRDVDSSDSPQVTYFVPVRPGQRRSYGNVGTCCGGTGMENHTKYQETIYFRSRDESALYVNLYASSTLRWPERRFVVTQATTYPVEGESRITVDGSGPLDIKLRVPVWAGKDYAVRINGAVQNVAAVPGTYVTLSRDWRPGDTIDISMRFRFRVERALDNPAVQSIFYGPILMAVQSGAVGNSLESGLIDFSFYRFLKLDGDLAPAMTPAGKPLHFTTNGRTLAPFFVADPGPSETSPYHLYFRRHEPSVVFGSIDSGVANRSRDDGFTFLDVVWNEAPFASHAQLLAATDRISLDWRGRGLLSEGERVAIRNAAEKARAAL